MFLNVPAGHVLIWGCLENKASLAKAASTGSSIWIIYKTKLIMIYITKGYKTYSCNFSGVDNVGAQRTFRVVSLLSTIARLDQGHRYGGTGIFLLLQIANDLNRMKCEWIHFKMMKYLQILHGDFHFSYEKVRNSGRVIDGAIADGKHVDEGVADNWFVRRNGRHWSPFWNKIKDIVNVYLSQWGVHRISCKVLLMTFQ